MYVLGHPSTISHPHGQPADHQIYTDLVKIQPRRPDHTIISAFTKHAVRGTRVSLHLTRHPRPRPNLLAPFFVGIDEPVSAAVVARYLIAVFKFRQNCFRQLLAQLNAPLVKGIDVPDDALHEDFVFV